ncbi:MAG: glycosyltransferase [Elusimicrobia bacterium]|nr:glycosyltransferase [Elusimicrobiota bacterium]
MIYIVILAYNEAGGIGQLLESVSGVLSKADEPCRLVVVNDGSKDGTSEIVEDMKKILPIDHLTHPTNLGVAKAFDTGLRHAASAARRDDVIVTMEGDRTNAPETLLAMAGLLRREALDVVCASRYAKGGAYVAFPPLRHFLSLGANFLTRLFFQVPGVRDYTIFFRAYRASIIQEALTHYNEQFIERRGFCSNAEILLKLSKTKRLRCGEVPLIYRYDLKKGRSKMKILPNMREYALLFAQAFIR